MPTDQRRAAKGPGNGWKHGECRTSIKDAPVMKWIAVFLILLFPATALGQSYRSERYRGYDYYKSFREQPKSAASLFSKSRQHDLRLCSPPSSCSPYPCREKRYDVEVYDHSTRKRERKTITVKPADRRYGW